MEPSDSTAVEWGTVDGNPIEAAGYYEPQTQPEDCVEMSSADIIDQVTGHAVSEADITHQAQSMSSEYNTDPSTGQPAALYIPNQGTNFEDAQQLLAAYGVSGTYTDDTAAASGGEQTGMDALAADLASGQHVMVSVDAETIWNAIGVEHSPDQHHSDHAVVVTGVDLTNGVVYLNDSGNPDTTSSGAPAGADEAVPLAVFEQAWAASGHAMITVDPSQTSSTTEAPAPSWTFGDNTDAPATSAVTEAETLVSSMWHDVPAAVQTEAVNDLRTLEADLGD